MNEYETILRLATVLPRSDRQLNRPFEADAELLRMGDEVWAFTTDEFSAEEDGFASSDPALLGGNLAVATLHDLLAVGADPAFFLSALVLPDGASPDFVDALTMGLGEVLAACGCHLLGGDLGQAADWRFTGTAFGPVVGTACTRRLAAVPAELWISGPLGDANAAFLTATPTPRFELRLELARALRGHALACIDTSGGLLDALWMLAHVNPRTRFALDVSAVPLAPMIRGIARRVGVPVSAFLVGGAGEYELLFAVSGEDTALRRELERLGAVRIGTADRSGAPGLFCGTDPAPACPDPRRGERGEYLAAVVAAGTDLERHR